MLLILTEEQSMKVFLETLIARYYPKLEFRIIPHRGKQDLEKHIPKILRNWNVPDTRFLIIHDQDSHDCLLLKAELQALCDSIRPDVIVRIACMELEAWYWGDLLAVERAFGKTKLQSLSRKSKYRVPDKINNPKSELKRYLPPYEQISGAKLIAQHADIERNTSHSFQVLLKSLQTLYSGAI
jgi:hypothetical protein